MYVLLSALPVRAQVSRLTGPNQRGEVFHLLASWYNRLERAKTRAADTGLPLPLDREGPLRRGQDDYTDSGLSW
jgi:hypothetical protein